MSTSDHDFRERLYTIDKKGHRLWVYEHVVSGFFRHRRRMIAFLLLAVYLGLPWIQWQGEQLVRLDLPARTFTFFGQHFYASDTEFLVVLLGAAAFGLFFVTAIFGRVWCGWACPETVFLEFVFRPLEALIEGPAATRRRADSRPWNRLLFFKKALKWGLFALISWILASTALAYFVGSESMTKIIQGSPWEHPNLFIITLVWMAGLLFQFGWFREQFCTVLCPYARFQSVLMDSKSLIVGYDRARGEPRGKNAEGHCIDCGLCVRVCPTGIDIRNGLQLECIQCTACADACDSVMAKLERPLKLIGYTTQEKLEGKQHRFVRPRIVIYTLILLVYGTVFSWLLFTKPIAEVRLLRKFAGQSPYSISANGDILNHLEAHITNKSNLRQSFQIMPSDRSDVVIISPVVSLEVEPGKLASLPFFISFKPSLTDRTITVKVRAGEDFSVVQQLSLIAPDSR